MLVSIALKSFSFFAASGTQLAFHNQIIQAKEVYFTFGFRLGPLLKMKM